MMSAALNDMLTKTVSTQAAQAVIQSWDLVMLIIFLAGAIVVIVALLGLYKMHKYNRPDYGEYKIIMLIFGVLMVNMDHVIDIFARTLGFG
jgi:heme/copper-type cytochrome/quinol oxidase subunit 2